MKATGITYVTCLGFNNCFGVAVDGKEYSVVNFYLEALESLLAENIIEWPIEVDVLDDSRCVVVTDSRIHDMYFRTGFCETCTPERLLPLPQRLAHARAIARGDREEKNGSVAIRMPSTAKLLRKDAKE